MIKGRMDATGVVRRGFHFAANDKVRIKSGPFRDFVGLFEKWVPASERVRVLLSLVGFQPTIELHSCMLEKVA